MIFLISLGVALFWVLFAWLVGVIGHALGLGNVSIPWMIGMGVGAYVGAFLAQSICRVGSREVPRCSSR
jgi:uncharacterized membrane protein YfcA